jgi:acetyltransferase-like isoleucine patch superfamily enzyme
LCDPDQVLGQLPPFCRQWNDEMRGLIVKIATAVCAALLPASPMRFCLRVLGHRIGARVRIGWSLVWVERLMLDDDAKIGNFNLLALRRLVMHAQSRIGRGNIAGRPLSIVLAPRAMIGNANKIVRGPQGLVTQGPAWLRLGMLTKITSNHLIDCTCSVRFGDNAILAGAASQVWTHGYIHDESGAGRYRIDAPVRIGDNVYIGSACIITMGVEIAAGVIVGAGTTVSRPLTEPGLYVGASIRRLPRPAPPDQRTDLAPINDPALVERVYRKRSPT